MKTILIFMILRLSLVQENPKPLISPSLKGTCIKEGSNTFVFEIENKSSTEIALWKPSLFGKLKILDSEGREVKSIRQILERSSSNEMISIRKNTSVVIEVEKDLLFQFPLEDHKEYVLITASMSYRTYSSGVRYVREF